MVELYQVDVSSETEKDIRKIFDYLLDSSSENVALKVSIGIADTIEKLEKMPTGNPIQHNISSEKRTFRFIKKWKYKIIYYVDEDAKIVKVVAVRHSSQHPDKLKDLL